MVTTWRNAIEPPANDPATEAPWHAADFERYCLGPIFRFFSCQLPSREDCEDLAMEVYAAYLKSPHKAHRANSPRAWLMQIAHRRLADHLRRKKTTLEPPDATYFDDAAYSMAVREVLHKLPDREREVLILKYVAELSHAEIAALQNASVDAVNSLLQRSRASFRKMGSHLIDPEEAI